MSEQLDSEIVAIQDEWIVHNRLKQRWMIVEEADGYSVHDHSALGVAPISRYPTKRKAAARLLQLLHVGPVAPQTWPEQVCIDTINGEPLPPSLA